MAHGVLKGIAAAAVAGALARRAWHKRLRYGPWGSLSAGLPEGVDSVGLALLQTTATSMVDENRLAWRDNGEVYIWKPGSPGERLADLVCGRAREGVAVRILVDPMGSRGFHARLYGRLREAGREVRYFRPLTERPFAFTG